MRELSLHLLDIAENSVAAGADEIEIIVDENLRNDRLRLVVHDNGRGMDKDLLAHVVDPFVTSRTTRKVGLGIPLLKAAAEACQGQLQLTSAPGEGARLEVEFQRSHIDRMPLGDLAGTWLTLAISFPNIHWLLRYQTDEAEFTYDNEPIKKELEGIPLTEPSVLAFIRELLQEGVGSVRRAIAKQESLVS